MKWSFRIARVSGIDIRVHVTFALVVLLGGDHAMRAYGPASFWFGALAILSLFLCVTLHELGHSLVAQRFGIRVHEIVLLPIGGVARLGREPSKPSHELLIAIAGPLVNVVIAVVLASLLDVHPLRLAGDDEFRKALFAAPTRQAFFAFLFGMNVMLAVFNMIPALPMDGGRVFRALLTFVFGRLRATNIASAVGQILALLLVVLAIQGPDPILMLIGMLVFFGAGQERYAARSKELLSHLLAGEVCDPNAVVVAPDDTIGTVVDHLLRGGQAHFAVMHGQQLIGTLSRDDVLAAAGKLGVHAPALAAARRDASTVEGSVPLDEVRAKLIETGGRPIVVMSADGPLGVLGLDDMVRIAGLAERLSEQGVRRRTQPELSSPN
jgi:Zn-dependent protease/CBS domain-containing protein